MAWVPKLLFALLIVVAESGCHAMRFELVDEPATQRVTERKSYFFWGLTPTQRIDVLSKCPHGAAAIMEETTFVDGLLQVPTLGIWAPRSTTYYCRGEPAAQGDRR